MSVCRLSTPLHHPPLPPTLVQVKKCADAGADIVRITVQGKREATACLKIRDRLFQDRWAPCVILGGLQGGEGGGAPAWKTTAGSGASVY